MSYQIFPTPNPNSLKFSSTGEQFLEAGMVACANRTEAEAHPLSSALFELNGVADVLILPQFVTVSKRSDSDWNELLPRVEQIMQSFMNR